MMMVTIQPTSQPKRDVIVAGSLHKLHIDHNAYSGIFTAV